MGWSDWKHRYSATLNPLRSERRLELVVVIIALLLLMQVLWGVVSRISYSGPSPISPSPDSLAVAAITDRELPEDAASQELVTRPLFWESRRAVGAPSTEEIASSQQSSSQGKKLDGVKVVGIFGSGSAGGAIVIAKGKKQRLSVNESLDGWTLESVAPDRAVFTSGTDRDEKLLSAAPPNVQYNTTTPAGPAQNPRPRAQQQESGDDELTLGG